ncbi:accessory factor UbiK family protein [Pelagibacteraceae bacterium]|nr:accessory factor UbiK family protein [Pelagibacteraceae bacterium]
MNNSDKILKLLSGLVEKGILTSQDIQKEILTKINFKKDTIIEKFDLVSRDEFEVLKRMIEKQNKEINVLKKKKIIKKAKKP